MKSIFILNLVLLTSILSSQEKLYVIPIHGNIEPALTVFIRKSIDEANKQDAHILFDINTFGGRVDSALQIATLIGSVKNRRTIAFIPADPEGLGVSWSAGALISFACKEIYMAEGTSIGAAAPVYMTPEGTQSAGEKTVSAVRTQMASLAEKNGYPPIVALAMVDKDIVLYEENINGKMVLKSKDELLSENNARVICPKGKLLTLSAKQMEYYGLSKKTVEDISDILRDINISAQNVTKLKPNIPDRIVSVITSTTVLGLLMTLGLITLYLALTSPGFGVLGTIGIISFATVFIGGQLLGTLGSLELLLFILGIALLAIEVFLIPGFGITGTLGLISMVLALILSQQDFIIPQWQWQWDVFNRNVLVVLSSIIGSFITITILMALFPRISLFNHLILKSGSDLSAETVSTSEKEIPIPETGIALTKLRPVGRIKIGDQITIGESQGAFIDKGKTIRITKRVGNRIIVKEDNSETTI